MKSGKEIFSTSVLVIILNLKWKKKINFSLKNLKKNSFHAMFLLQESKSIESIKYLVIFAFFAV